MTTHSKTEKLLTSLVKRVDKVLTDDKERNKTIQSILTDFIDNYSDALGENSTPLSKLLHGLKRTDATLVKMYVEEVTNAKIGLNDKNRLVIKLEKDTKLETNENYGVITWYDLAKDTKTVKKDHFDSIDQALRAYRKWFEKAIITCESKTMLKQLRDGIKQAETDVIEKLENK